MTKKTLFALLITLNLYSVDDYDFKQYTSTIKFKGEIISSKAFELKSKGAILIDVRTQKEYDFSHIADAFWIPVYFEKYGKRKYNKNFISSVLEVINDDKSKEIILISKKGIRSRYAANILSDNGLTNVYSVQNGFLFKDGWIDSGYQYIRSNEW